MAAIFWKEVKSYFYSPMAYILIGLFILLTSIFFLPYLRYGYGLFNDVLSTMGFILLVIVPVLTMRILAEDRKHGTEVLLITSPVNITSVVVGKFLAVYFVFLYDSAYIHISDSATGIRAKFTVQLIGGYIGFLLLGQHISCRRFRFFTD